LFGIEFAGDNRKNFSKKLDFRPDSSYFSMGRKITRKPPEKVHFGLKVCVASDAMNLPRTPSALHSDDLERAILNPWMAQAGGPCGGSRA